LEGFECLRINALFLLSLLSQSAPLSTNDFKRQRLNLELLANHDATEAWYHTHIQGLFEKKVRVFSKRFG
jgi:hypothetical protein